MEDGDGGGKRPKIKWGYFRWMEDGWVGWVGLTTMLTSVLYWDVATETGLGPVLTRVQ